MKVQLIRKSFSSKENVTIMRYNNTSVNSLKREQPKIGELKRRFQRERGNLSDN